MKETISRVNESRRTKKYDPTPLVDKLNAVVHSTGADVGVKGCSCSSYKLNFSDSGTPVARLPPPLDGSPARRTRVADYLWATGVSPAWRALSIFDLRRWEPIAENSLYNNDGEGKLPVSDGRDAELSRVSER